MPIGVYDHWKLRGRPRSIKYRHSEETKRKIGLSNLGKKKGRKESLELRKKLSDAQKRAWTNGHYTKERNEKIRKTMQRLYREGKLKIGSMKMDKHPAWKGGISYSKRTIRYCLMNHKEYKKWRKDVFERDDYTCQNCKSKRGGNLEAHHIKGWDSYPNLRYCISNGLTLCKSCHYQTFTK